MTLSTRGTAAHRGASGGPRTVWERRTASEDGSPTRGVGSPGTVVSPVYAEEAPSDAAGPAAERSLSERFTTTSTAFCLAFASSGSELIVSSEPLPGTRASVPWRSERGSAHFRGHMGRRSGEWRAAVRGLWREADRNTPSRATEPHCSARRSAGTRRPADTTSLTCSQSGLRQFNHFLFLFS